MKRKIVLDSSSNLWQLPGVDYACVPLKIITDEQEYVDEPGTRRLCHGPRPAHL